MKLYVDIEKHLGDFHLHAQFEAQDGITGLLGASGCGKSMTLKCIAGVETPDRGLIRMDDLTLFDSAKKINLPPQKRQVGYLFQSYALFPHMTVEQNIQVGLHRISDRQQRRQRLQELCDLLQLQGLEHLRPHQLSGGQAQRVALGRILASQPHFLLLDEPFSALDSHLRDQLQPQLYTLLQALKLPALLVTHSRDEAYRLCQTLRIMEQGRIIRQGSTQAVFADPGSIPAARITGCKNIAAARPLGSDQVEVPDWGITLHVPVPEALAAVGIHAHAFCPSQGEDGFPICCLQTLEEPFEKSILFRFPQQRAETPPLWWRVPKSQCPNPLPQRLCISELLLLTEGEP